MRLMIITLFIVKVSESKFAKVSLLKHIKYTEQCLAHNKHFINFAYYYFLLPSLSRVERKFRKRLVTRPFFHNTDLKANDILSLHHDINF